MIVVADTSPLNYLILIGAASVLEPLYSRVVVPEMVSAEMKEPQTPAEVRAWIDNPPAWLDIMPNPPADASLYALDAGERAAIGLAISLKAHLLLIDDADGRDEAERRHLRVTGTLGVLAAAHRSKLLNFDTAIELLGNTTFYVSPRLLATARRLLS
jgi:predicted nucleic acid-binding protein